MTSRQELFSHQEKLWVLCLAQDSIEGSLPPLADLVDWFNNQLLAKSLLNAKVTLGFGDTALLATSGLLPVKRLLVFGLGKAPVADAETTLLAQETARKLDEVLEGLQEETPWVVLAPHLPAPFLTEFEKTRTSYPRLAQAKISLR